MHIDTIKLKIAGLIQHSSEWIDKLSDTEPGNCGVEDWEVRVSEEDVIVNILKRTFYFRDASFCFDVLLGSSNPDDGFRSSFSRDAKGSGSFNFIDNAQNIEIEDLKIEVDLDLYSEMYE